MKKEHLKLSKLEEEKLKKLLSKGSLKVLTSKRIISLLELNKGKTYESVSSTVDLATRTIRRLAARYKTDGLSCIKERQRSGRPLKIDSKEVDLLTVLSCSEAPAGYAQWSLRLLADKMVELNYSDGISHTQVGNILKKRK